MAKGAYVEVTVPKEPGSMVSVKSAFASPLLPRGAKALVESYIRMQDGTVRAMSTLTPGEVAGLVEDGLLDA